MYPGFDMAKRATSTVRMTTAICPALSPFSLTTSLEIMDDRLRMMEFAVVTAAAMMLNATSSESQDGMRVSSVGVTSSL